MSPKTMGIGATTLQQVRPTDQRFSWYSRYVCVSCCKRVTGSVGTVPFPSERGVHDWHYIMRVHL